MLDKCEIMSVHLRINQAGGLFDNGRRSPNFVRERVLDLHHDGVSQRTIAQQLCASRRFVQNVLRDYDLTNSCFQPPKRHKGHTVLTPDAAECIEILNLVSVPPNFRIDLFWMAFYTPRTNLIQVQLPNSLETNY